MSARKPFFYLGRVLAMCIVVGLIDAGSMTCQAQVTLALEAMQPLPNGMVSTSEPQVRHLQLQAFPLASAPVSQKFVQLPSINLQPITPATPWANDDLEPKSVSIQPLEPVRASGQASGGPILDVNAMINRPLDGIEVFANLKSKLPNLHEDRRFFDSSVMAEPIRLQSNDGSPYLWNASAFCWQSPAFCFSPLYFEQPNYERYGQGKGKPWASTVSAARFVGQVTTLPIAVFCTPPWTKSCTLGHHRPGDCAPYQRKSEPH